MKVSAVVLSFVMVSQAILGGPALAQSDRVTETMNQAARSLDEQIREKRQQEADAEAALDELETQLFHAKYNATSSGRITLKRVFLVTAVASAAVLVYGLANTKSSGVNFPIPIPGRGTFVGLLGLLASGVGYMATDASEISLSSDEESKMAADVKQAKLEVAALKRALARLENQSR
jgi:hypothetical protein